MLLAEAAKVRYFYCVHLFSVVIVGKAGQSGGTVNSLDSILMRHPPTYHGVRKVSSGIDRTARRDGGKNLQLDGKLETTLRSSPKRTSSS